jgi:D-alanyl-D-alanine carboxypeptidase
MTASRLRVWSILLRATLVLGFLVGACSSRPSTSMNLQPAMRARSPVSPWRSSSGPSWPSAASPSPTPTGVTFHATISAIDGATRVRMASSSWHPGCPVAIEDLRLLSLDYFGFDGMVHTGEMVVHRDVARDVVTVFRALFDARFPIRRMQLVDAYGGSDDRSMAADNTSAFNCRLMTGGASWSQHAYGRAIDINPIQNPYVTRAGTVEPPAGASYVDRSLRAKGMVHAGDVVADAFASVGWGWGGAWSDPIDYQHFSATGR